MTTGRAAKRPVVRFSWENFCNDYGVHFVTSGPNVARGHVAIRCPFCGDSDPSEHMGLSLDIQNPAWGCWRNADHRGRHPARLVRELLGCSNAMAEEVIQSLSGALPASLRVAPEQPAPVGPLLMPEAFKELRRGGYGEKFAAYLEARGFDDIERLSSMYDLRYCLVGDYKWRLVIPIYESQQLVTWTARSIQIGIELRYKTLSHLPSKFGGPTALRSIKESIYNWDALQAGGETLVVTEGPMDALKIDFYARPLGIHATCLFGTAITDAQAILLARVGRKFKRVFQLLDRGANTVSWKLTNQLQELLPQVEVRSLLLPPDVKDPGDLTKEAVRELFQ